MRHVCYGVVNKNGDPIIGKDGNILCDAQLLAVEKLIEFLSISNKKMSPYKPVRILIDEIEDDKKI